MNKGDSKHKEKKIYTRRQFFKSLWKVTGVVFLAQSTWIVFNFLKPQTSKETTKNKIRAGMVDDYPINSVTYFPEGQFFLARFKKGFMALSRKCPHLGCVISWEAEKDQFFCPCHAGILNKTGEVVAGPIPRPLDLFSIEIIDKQIVVDINRIVKRTGYDESQLII